MGLLSPHYICTALLACMHAAYLPACATGIRSGSPHDVLHRTSNDDNNDDDNNISYVLAPAYKRLYFIRDVTYISRAHALRANVKPAHESSKVTKICIAYEHFSF